jgi:hypothetical protein
MKSILILELQNVEQLFGGNFTPYAMFTGRVDGENVELGITHNALRRKGYDTSPAGLQRLIGCTLETKDFVDSRTGEMVNGDERVEMVLDGTNRLVLFNSVNCNIKVSDVYKQENTELIASTNAKLKIEQDKELRNAKKQALLERLISRTTPNVASEQQAEEVETPELTLED